MTFRHVVVWLDREQAHIIHFNREAAHGEAVRAAHHPAKGGMPASGHSKQDNRYLDDIVATLRGAEEILIVGPGLEKTVLLKHLMKRHHELAEKIVGVETIDHPSEGQLLAYARKYFLRADQLI